MNCFICSLFAAVCFFSRNSPSAPMLFIPGYLESIRIRSQPLSGKAEPTDVLSGISFSGLSSLLCPSVPWVTWDPHINKRKKKKSVENFCFTSHRNCPLANDPIWLQPHVVPQLPPDSIRGDLALGGASWAKLIPVMFLRQGKVVECPLWCFERKLYRNNVPSSVAIEKPFTKGLCHKRKSSLIRPTNHCRWLSVPEGL